MTKMPRLDWIRHLHLLVDVESHLCSDAQIRITDTKSLAGETNVDHRPLW